MGRMNGIDVLLDFAARPKDVLTALPGLSAGLPWRLTTPSRT